MSRIGSFRVFFFALLCGSLHLITFLLQVGASIIHDWCIIPSLSPLLHSKGGNGQSRFLTLRLAPRGLVSRGRSPALNTPWPGELLRTSCDVYMWRWRWCEWVGGGVKGGEKLWNDPSKCCLVNGQTESKDLFKTSLNSHHLTMTH